MPEYVRTRALFAAAAAVLAAAIVSTAARAVTAERAYWRRFHQQHRTEEPRG